MWSGSGGRESWYTISEIVNKWKSFYNYTEINSEKIYWYLFSEKDTIIVLEIFKIIGYVYYFWVW